MNKPAITPKTKVAELLNNYPELENLLIDLSPEFKKLKNPILRRTVAKITTLEQASKISGVDIGTIINTLRRAAGQDEYVFNQNSKDVPFMNDFETISPEEISEIIDARPIISSGGHPLDMVMNKLTQIEEGRAICLITPFIPIPMIEIAKNRNYKVMVEKNSENEFRTYFKK